MESHNKDIYDYETSENRFVLDAPSQEVNNVTESVLIGAEVSMPCQHRIRLDLNNNSEQISLNHAELPQIPIFIAECQYDEITSTSELKCDLMETSWTEDGSLRYDEIEDVLLKSDDTESASLKSDEIIDVTSISDEILDGTSTSGETESGSLKSDGIRYGSSTSDKFEDGLSRSDGMSKCLDGNYDL